jgi:EAL domain-containing protein (putative c-di-GMP-specific phosphodiesterase class I)
VNVSVAQIVAGTLLADVRAALDRSGLDPGLLHLEVTESLFATDHAQTIPTLQALRAMGIRISLDDFGIGFSSLGYLRTLPIDTIKIDKTFIDNVEGESRAIVEAIQTIARAFSLGVVAEGVETLAQADALRALAIPSLQGFYFSRPLEADAVSSALERRVLLPANGGRG